MNEERLLVIFMAIFLISLSLIVFESAKNSITGYASTGETVSNVTISKYISIDMSANLGSGILFGTINTLPAYDINATHNNDSGSDGTTFILNVSTDSNTAADFCIKANTDLMHNTDVLSAGNESYANATITDATTPAQSAQVSFTTSYVKAGENVAQGNGTYYRFWLDVPSGTPSGTYNNTISFKGVETTTSC